MSAHEWATPAAITAGLAVVGVIARALRVDRLPHLTRRAGEFFDDWNGEPARPGREAVKPFPERMAILERRTADLDHRLRGDVTSSLQLLLRSADENKAQGRSNEEALARLDARVTDHRRRNEQQIELLREAISHQNSRLDEITRRSYQRRATDPKE